VENFRAHYFAYAGGHDEARLPNPVGQIRILNVHGIAHPQRGQGNSESARIRTRIRIRIRTRVRAAVEAWPLCPVAHIQQI